MFRGLPAALVFQFGSVGDCGERVIDDAAVPPINVSHFTTPPIVSAESPKIVMFVWTDKLRKQIVRNVLFVQSDAAYRLTRRDAAVGVKVPDLVTSNTKTVRSSDAEPNKEAPFMNILTNVLGFESVHGRRCETTSESAGPNSAAHGAPLSSFQLELSSQPN